MTELQDIVKIIMIALKRKHPDDPQEQFRQLRQFLISQGMGINYDQDSRRMILYTSKSCGAKRKNYCLLKFCNGTVLTFDNELLCLPPPAPNYSWDTETVRTRFQNGNYRVFKAIPGTIFTMYYDKKWLYSTLRGLDNRRTNIRGYKLKTAINELREKSKLSFDMLDKKHSYTFGISHPQIHCTSDPKIWLVCSTDLKTGTYQYYKESPFPNVEIQPEVKDITFEQITDQKFVKGRAGYILRDEKNDIPECNVFVESPWMESMRKMVWAKKIDPHYDHMKYVTLAAYLGEDRGKFEQLFDVSDVFAKWDKLNNTTQQVAGGFKCLLTKHPDNFSRWYYVLFENSTSWDLNYMYVAEPVEVPADPE